MKKWRMNGLFLIRGVLVTTRSWNAGHGGVYVPVTQNVQANQSLKYEIDERQKTIYQLEESKALVNTLSGIVPICMHCKGIRDDQGYWNQLEKFITEHSEVQFSHSICDNCMEKYYPDLEE